MLWVWSVRGSVVMARHLEARLDGLADDLDHNGHEGQPEEHDHKQRQDVPFLDMYIYDILFLPV